VETPQAKAYDRSGAKLDLGDKGSFVYMDGFIVYLSEMRACTHTEKDISHTERARQNKNSQTNRNAKRRKGPLVYISTRRKETKRHKTPTD
jgi:hypothetical protein